MRLLPCFVAAGLVSGCIIDAGGDGTPPPTPQCTPPAEFIITATVHGVNAQALAGDFAMAHLIEGGGGALVCSSAQIAAGGTFQVAPQFTIANGPSTTLELVLNSGNEATFGPGDHHYSFQLGVDGTQTGGSCSPIVAWDLPFDYATAVPGAVTWPLGTGC